MSTEIDPDSEIEEELVSLQHRLRRGQLLKAGFPGAEDIDYQPLWRFLAFELNNIGDPTHEPAFAHHTKAYEREAVNFFASMLGAPADDRWGYVTSGSTECLQYGLLRGRRYYPDGITYYSTSAHYKVARVLDDLRMPSIAIPAAPSGELSYADLDRAIAVHAGRPAIILATAGTTMTEATDDLAKITNVLNNRRILDRYIHVDGALSAIPLALLPDDVKPAFDFAAGADSIGFSLHKFLATRMPGGIVIARNSPPPGTRPRIPYTGAADSTMTCSRNGHMALMAWYAVRTLKAEGLRRRAEDARANAAYLVERLEAMAWPAWRNPHAFTVVMATPPRRVASKWQLATNNDGWSHYICLPGRGRPKVDEFVQDLYDGLMSEGGHRSIGTAPVTACPTSA